MEASGVLQAELFFFAATEIRIGCGIPLSPRLLQAEPFFFAATKIRIGYGRPLSLRPLQAEPFFFAATKNRIGRGESLQSRGKIGKNHAVIPKSGHQLMNQCKMDIFEGAKEFGTFLETRGNANQNPKRYERHYQTCFISSIGSCGHSGPCQQLRPVKRRKLYNFTQQFFIIA